MKIQSLTAQLAILMIGLGLSTDALAQTCKNGQPCGNSCISWNKVCRIGSETPATPAAPATPATPAVKPARAPGPAVQRPVAPLVTDSPASTRILRVDGTAFEWPAFEARVVAHIKAGTAVTAYRTQGQWIRISQDSMSSAAQWVHEAVLVQ